MGKRLLSLFTAVLFTGLAAGCGISWPGVTDREFRG